MTVTRYSEYVDDDMYDDEDSETPEKKVPISFFSQHKADQDVYMIAAYVVERNYGGPEEGGWWFDSGTLVEVTACRLQDRMAAIEHMQKKYVRTGKRYSVLGGQDHDIHVSKNEYPPLSFPANRLHYE